jgi:MATE family multidrug resistance protein
MVCAPCSRAVHRPAWDFARCSRSRFPWCSHARANREALAATATGGFNVYLFATLAGGTAFIVQSFVAQHVGRGERDLTPRYAWYGMAIALIAQFAALACIPAISPVLGWVGYGPVVHDEMRDYMAIRLCSVAAIVAVDALGNWYGGLGNTWMAMVAGVISMVTAIFFNWVLIDGHFGAPAMGVSGAALSAVIASWLSFAFLAVAFWRRWGMAVGGPAPARHLPLALSWRDLRRVVRFGLPNGLNWFLEFSAFQLFVNVVFAGLGAETQAAFNVVLALNTIGFMPAFGLATSGAILAGQAIGAGAKDAVWPTVRLTLACTLAWMGFMGIVYLVAPHALIGAFASAETTPRFIEIGTLMLLISAAWQLFDAVGMTLYETLRAAGDTTWTAVVRIILAWGVFTPVALIVVKVWNGGAVGAMLCLVGYLVLLSTAFAYRFRSGRWRSIELIEPKLV